MAKIEPAIEVTPGNFSRNLGCFIEHRLREVSRQIMLLNNTEDLNLRIVRRTQNLDDLSFRTDMPVFPSAQANHDLVIERRPSTGGVVGQGHIYVVHLTRIIRNYVVEFLRLLKR